MAVESNAIDITSCNGEIACVKLTGDFYSDSVANEVATQIDGLFSAGVISILLNLSEASINRSLVDRLIPLHKQATRNGKELRIESRSDQVQEFFNGMGLLNLVTQIPMEDSDK